MDNKIQKSISTTAQWTCIARAMSFREENKYLKSEDSMAQLFVPDLEKVIAVFNNPKINIGIPKGGYEQVIARTKYIDNIFYNLNDNVEQIVILGAGFDSRSLRFKDILKNKKVFEIDSAFTQNAKINHLKKMNVDLPPNLTFVPADFLKDSLESLLENKLIKDRINLFILEGLIMYLDTTSVDTIFNFISKHSQKNSLIFFDYVTPSFKIGDNEMYKATADAGEKCNFFMESKNLPNFLANYGFDIVNEYDTVRIIEEYFTDENGIKKVDIIGNHGNLVTAIKT